jgi:hypothetical protein
MCSRMLKRNPKSVKNVRLTIENKLVPQIEQGMGKQHADMRQQPVDQQNYIEKSLNLRDERLMLTLQEMTEAQK